jgi:hypothetical protein
MNVLIFSSPCITERRPQGIPGTHEAHIPTVTADGKAIAVPLVIRPNFWTYGYGRRFAVHGHELVVDFQAALSFFGHARELVLTVYRPLCMEEAKWNCAFAFGAGANEPVRYGVGTDFIEALLDALALARITYESMIPAEWQPPESSQLDSVHFWPHKIGREYFTEPSRYSNPDMPEFGPSWLRGGT